MLLHAGAYMLWVVAYYIKVCHCYVNIEPVADSCCKRPCSPCRFLWSVPGRSRKRATRRCTCRWPEAAAACSSPAVHALHHVHHLDSWNEAARMTAADLNCCSCSTARQPCLQHHEQDIALCCPGSLDRQHTGSTCHSTCSYMTKNPKTLFARAVLSAPDPLRPAVYMGIHAIMCLLAIMTAKAAWESWSYHTIFLLLCLAVSAWNGGERSLCVRVCAGAQDTDWPAPIAATYYFSPKFRMQHIDKAAKSS